LLEEDRDENQKKYQCLVEVANKFNKEKFKMVNELSIDLKKTKGKLEETRDELERMKLKQQETELNNGTLGDMVEGLLVRLDHFQTREVIDNGNVLCTSRDHPPSYPPNDPFLASWREEILDTENPFPAPEIFLPDNWMEL
jgi:hypothetical protein